jgi:hypothetical protein
VSRLACQAKVRQRNAYDRRVWEHPRSCGLPAVGEHDGSPLCEVHLRLERPRKKPLRHRASVQVVHEGEEVYFTWTDPEGDERRLRVTHLPLMTYGHKNDEVRS